VRRQYLLLRLTRRGSWEIKKKLMMVSSKYGQGYPNYGAMTGGCKNLDLKYPPEDIFVKDISPVLILHGSYDAKVSVKHGEALVAVVDEKKIPYETEITREQGIVSSYKHIAGTLT
jgi:hypothetical protein